MLIKVIVKTKQKLSLINKIENISQKENELKIDLYEIKVKSLPIENKANLEVIEILSKYFQVAKLKIKLKSGSKGKLKIFEIG